MSPLRDENGWHEQEDEQRRYSNLYIVRDLQRRLGGVERKITEMHDRVYKSSYWIEGSTQVFTEIKTELGAIKQRLYDLERKQTRWEGGGAVIYGIITLAGGFIGWLVSKLGFGH